MFKLPHSSNLALKCLTSWLLSFSPFCARIPCEHLLQLFTNVRQYEMHKSTPAKFGVCYKIVGLTTSIKLIRIHVLTYLLVYVCCNGSSFDTKSDKYNTLETISVVGEGNLYPVL